MTSYTTYTTYVAKYQALDATSLRLFIIITTISSHWLS